MDTNETETVERSRNLADLAELAGLPVEVVEEFAGDLKAAFGREVVRKIVQAMVQDQLDEVAAENRQFESYTYDDLLAIPEPGWVIDGVIPAGNDTMVFGEAWSGKTMVVLDMLLSIVNGIPWFGHETKKRPCALVVGEGRFGIPKRIEAWLAAHPDTSADGLLIIPAMPDIRNPKSIEQFLRAFEPWENVPKVIAWDTWSRLSAGSNENDPSAMTECVTMLRFATEVFGINDAASIVVHHTGHDEKDRPRGASTFTGAFNTLIRVTPTQISNTKQKDAELFKPHGFELVKIAHSVYLESAISFSAAIREDAELERSVIELVNEEPGISASDIRKTLRKNRTKVFSVVEVLVSNERIREVVGERGAKKLYPV
jgi:hypothetical protein